MENAVHSWTFVQQFWCTMHKNKKIDFNPNFSTSFSFVFAEINIINFFPDLDAFTAKAIYLCVGRRQGRSFFLIICYACSLWIKKNLFLKKIAHFNDRNNNFFDGKPKMTKITVVKFENRQKKYFWVLQIIGVPLFPCFIKSICGKCGSFLNICSTILMHNA